ncbi:MAG: hypothetical protein ACI978_002793 [Oleispira sp.]|jgi:hypothetical protein
MTNKLFTHSYSLLFILMLSITGCDTDTNKEESSRMNGNKSSQPLVFTVGEYPTDFIQRMKNIGQTIGVDRQPAGLNFYTIDFPQGTRKIAQIEHGPYSFDTPPVMGFMGTENMDFPESGINDLDFTFVRKDDGQKNTHEQAREFFMGYIKMLADLGWQRFISPSEPRLSGPQSYQYILEDDHYYVPDLNVEPNLKTWKAMENSHIWTLYADNLFMEIKYRRKQDPSDQNKTPDESAYYIFSLEITTKDEFAKGYMDFANRDTWQQHWASEIKPLKTLRYKIEAELRDKGYIIDTSYQDPIIHPNDPIEPD